MKINELFHFPKSYLTREVGIEVEMESDSPAIAGAQAAYWRAHADGSLRGNSVEYVLQRPILRRDVKDAIVQLKLAIKKIGSTISDSDRAGVHIHLNCQPLEEQQVFNFIVLYLMLENTLLRYCGDDREGNLFCLRAIDAGMLINVIVHSMNNGGLLSAATNASIRYASINLTALSKYGSLEFRALKTPTDLEKIIPWISLLLRIKDSALSFKESRNIIESMSAMGGTQFIRQVFGDMADSLITKDTDDLVQQSIWAMQDLAFLPPIKEMPNKAVKPVKLVNPRPPIPQPVNPARPTPRPINWGETEADRILQVLNTTNIITEDINWEGEDRR